MQLIKTAFPFEERLFFRLFAGGWKNIEKSLKKVLTEERSSVNISFVAEQQRQTKKNQNKVLNKVLDQMKII